jgi:hypothetical protein
MELIFGLQLCIEIKIKQLKSFYEKENRYSCFVRFTFRHS